NRYLYTPQITEDQISTAVAIATMIQTWRRSRGGESRVQAKRIIQAPTPSRFCCESVLVWISRKKARGMRRSRKTWYVYGVRARARVKYILREMGSRDEIIRPGRRARIVKD